MSAAVSGECTWLSGEGKGGMTGNWVLPVSKMLKLDKVSFPRVERCHPDSHFSFLFYSFKICGPLDFNYLITSNYFNYLIIYCILKSLPLTIFDSLSFSLHNYYFVLFI